MVAETSRVMIPARAGPLSASPATMAASAVLRNVENIVTSFSVAPGAQHHAEAGEAHNPDVLHPQRHIGLSGRMDATPTPH
jgi:hypothetical protein